MHGVALFPNYFMNAIYYTALAVLTQLRMKLMPSIPFRSRVEGQKRGVDLHNILPTPVVLTHFFFGWGGQFCPFHL